MVLENENRYTNGACLGVSAKFGGTHGGTVITQNASHVELRGTDVIKKVIEVVIANEAEALIGRITTLSRSKFLVPITEILTESANRPL